jgi:sarcosine oxidase
MKVAVVGAGIAGSSAARYIAIKGHDVALFEQFGLGHDLGSSHGNSRIVRRAYPDAFYTECMEEAYPLWAELERHADRRLLNEVGLMYFGSSMAPDVVSMIANLKDLAVPYEIYGLQQVQDVMPGFNLANDEIGVFTREAGWVDAKASVEANISVLRSLGGVILTDHPVHWEQLEADFDSFVVCAGPWIRQFVPIPVKCTLQTFAYVQVEEPRSGPVWIEEGHLGMYGFPTEPDRIDFKIGVHELGREVGPSDLDRTPSADHCDLIMDCAQRRFGISSPTIVHAKGCIYTSEANDDFIVGRIGERGYFASACSGHGFKFGPWIGKLMAKFVEGEDEPEAHRRFFWPGPWA